MVLQAGLTTTGGYMAVSGLAVLLIPLAGWRVLWFAPDRAARHRRRPGRGGRQVGGAFGPPMIALLLSGTGMGATALLVALPIAAA